MLKRVFRVAVLLPVLMFAQSAAPTARVTHAGLLATAPFTSLSDMAVDAAGNVYLTGRTEAHDFPATHEIGPGFSTKDIVVVKFDPLLSKILYATRIGGPRPDSGQSIAVDSDGAVYVAGFTFGELPVTTGVFAPGPRQQFSYCVTKLNPEGSLAWLSYFRASDLRDIAVDPSGRPWVVGGDNRGNVPTTADAIQPEHAGGVCFTEPNFRLAGLGRFQCTDAFVARLAQDGSAIEYATFLGGRGGEGEELVFEQDGERVVLGSDSAAALGFGPNGAVYVTGFTTSPDFPVTEGAVRTELHAGEAFLSRLSPDGDKLEWSTFLGGDSSDAGFAVAVDSQGAPVVLGGFGHTAGFSSDAGVHFNPQSSWLARISADGDQVSAFTNLSMAGALVVAEDDTAWVKSGRPTINGLDYPIGPNLLTGVAVDGSIVGHPADMSGLGPLLAYHGQGVFYMAGVDENFAGAAATAVQTVIGAGPSTIGVARVEGTGGLPGYIGRVENAASRISPPARRPARSQLSPGELISIMGSALGPADGVIGQPEKSGLLPTALGGTRVFLDERPLPLIYVSSEQINTVVPFNLAGKRRVRLTIERDGRRFGFLDLDVLPVNLGIFTEDFTGRGQTVMNNEDNSRNSWFNPAPTGSVVTFFATGLGATDPPMTDGRINAESTANPEIAQPFTVDMGARPAEIVSVRRAPGHVAGVWEIRARIPFGLPADSGHWVIIHYPDGARSQTHASVAVAE